MKRDGELSLNIEYSLIEHLKLLSEKDSKYNNLYATWIIDERSYTSALQAVSNTFPHYSMHDSSHSLSIINKIEMVLGEDRIRELSPTDTFLILECAYLHDFGMITSVKEQKELWEKPEFKKYLEDIMDKSADKDLVEAACYIKDIKNKNLELDQTWPIKIKSYVTILNADYFRKRHTRRSAEFIMNCEYGDVLANHNKLIPKRIIRLISQVAAMHGTDFEYVMNTLARKDNGIATDKIHPRMIACLLRLGDLLDLDNGRFNDTFEKTVLMPETSKEQKEKHQAITHFLVSPKRIEVSAICPNSSVYRATRQWFDWLEEELKNLSCKWSDIVPDDFIGGPPSLGDIKLSIEDDNGVSEQLNFNKILF